MFIELTSGYVQSKNPKFLINSNHVIYVSPCDMYNNGNYAGVNSYVEYIGGKESQVAYVQETFEQIKELLK